MDADRFEGFTDLVNTERIHIGVIGMAYVGLPLSPAFCEAGFRVLGFDIDSEKVSSFDVVVISTDHSCIDFESLARDAQLVIDTRHACKSGRHIVRA